MEVSTEAPTRFHGSFHGSDGRKLPQKQWKLPPASMETSTEAIEEASTEAMEASTASRQASMNFHGKRENALTIGPGTQLESCKKMNFYRTFGVEEHGHS